MTTTAPGERADLANGGPHPGAGGREQTRAVYPDVQGHLDRDGVRVWYEAYGTGQPTIMLYPTWEISHSRSWKLQIPYLARHARVVTFDRRGNGRSDRPADPAACHPVNAVGDALAVLDELRAERVMLVAWCGDGDDLMLATQHPERIAGLVLISSNLQLTAEPAEDDGPLDFDGEPGTDPAGWRKWNRHYWQRDWPGFLEFFFAQVFNEPHSTKQIEDAVGWGLETDPQTILRAMETPWPNERDTALRLCAQVRCPTLVIQGSNDAVVGPRAGGARGGRRGGRRPRRAAGHLRGVGARAAPA